MKVSKESKLALENIIARIEELEEDNLTLRNEVSTLESKLEDKDVEIDKLLSDIEELDAEVKRLDDALADTYVSVLDPAIKARSE